MRSTPLTESSRCEGNKPATVHCQGRVLRLDSQSLVVETGQLLHVSPTLPGADVLRLYDIGRAGE